MVVTPQMAESMIRCMDCSSQYKSCTAVTELVELQEDREDEVQTHTRS